MSRYKDTEGKRRTMARQMWAWLDRHAKERFGLDSVLDIQADALDVQQFDEAITKLFDHLTPERWLQGRIERAPQSEEAALYAEKLSGTDQQRQEVLRYASRHLKQMRSVWDKEIRPGLQKAHKLGAKAKAISQQAPTIQELLQDELLQIPSDYLPYQLSNAIAHPQKFKTQAELAPTPFPTVFLKHGRAEVLPQEATRNAWMGWDSTMLSSALQTMNQRLETFKPRTRDVYLILLAKWANHEASGKKGNPWIGVDECLQMMGYEQKLDGEGRRYGFPDDLRQQVREDIENLAHIDVHFQHKEKRGRRRVQMNYSGRFLMLGDRRGQVPLGGSKVEGFTDIEFDIPALAGQGVSSAPPQYLHLHIKALQYPDKKAALKSLAIYLTYLARVNPGGRFSVGIRKLLQETGREEIDTRKAAAIRRTLEEEIGTLAKDGLVLDWKYKNSDWDVATRQAWEDGKRPRGWLDDWLEQPILVQMPDELSYPTIQAHRQEKQERRQEKQARLTAPPPEMFALVRTDNPQALAGQLAAAIATRNVSKVEAAESMGVSRPTLDNLLAGKPTREAVREKAAAWMRKP